MLNDLGFADIDVGEPVDTFGRSVPVGLSWLAGYRSSLWGASERSRLQDQLMMISSSVFV
jgi:hypothetical protein